MAMDLKHDQQRETAAWPRQTPGRRRRGAAADATRPGRPEAVRSEPARDPVFDIADFEAIADFAGLRRVPARIG
jgi:hypothetical protein